MIAQFDGQDYFFYLDRNKQEMKKLLDEPINAPLERPWAGGEWGKTATLTHGENSGSDGINVKYLPEGAGSWDDVKQVQVTVNQRAYGHIQGMGRFGTRYGMGDKIEIIDGLPDQI